MKPTILISAMLAALAAGSHATATPAAPAFGPGSAARDDKTVNLTPFTVSGSASEIGRYASLESISAGRVRRNIMDSSQSISVLTNEVIEDVAASRVLDATRFVAGVTDATLPTSWEFTFMRGFLAEGRTVDGVTYGTYPSSGFQNIDPAIIERIEVVKGPNSILAPQPTSPGGTANLATKKPQFRDFGLVRFQWGRFDADGGFLDVNRTAGDNLAFRLVASRRDQDHWWQDAWVRSTTLMPALTWRLSEKAEAILQYTYTDWNAQNYFGLPIDPASGTTTEGRLLGGVPRDLNVYADDVVRDTRQHEFKLLLTAELWKGIQMRLLAATNTSSQYAAQINNGPSTTGPGGSVNPLTGQWVPGFGHAQMPPFAAFPLPVSPTRIIVRSGTELSTEPQQFHLQNDYAWLFESDSLKSTTLVGFAYVDRHNDHSKAYNLSAPPYNIDRYADTPWTRGALNYSNRTAGRFKQAYVSQTLSLLQGRLILNAAESWQDYYDRLDNLLGPLSPTGSHHSALPSYGVVIKPRGDTVSLYYAHTEQSSATSPGISGTFVPALSTSRQDEYGARFKVWDSKVYFTVSRYEIAQDNYATPNPGNLVTPPPNPLLPPVLSDRQAEGWEYELRANPTRNLSLMASYTHLKNRDPNNVEFRGVAEKAGSVLTSYAFDRESVPALAGLRVAVGADHVGRRAGDGPANTFTAASTPDNPIPVQPSFYLGARTLVNLTLAYESKHNWGVQVNVDNLLDEEYLQASIFRFAVFPGPARNVRVSVWRAF